MLTLTSKLVYLVLLTYVQVNPVHAATAYEEEIAETLFQRTEQGEPVWLYADDQRFLGLYSPHRKEQSPGAAIIVHGMGTHPDWPEVVAPVRNTLPAAGWATLAIQMPLLEPGEPLADYGKTINQAGNRIRAAIQFLRDRKFFNIVIIGYGFGAVTATNFLAQDPITVQAFISIGMQSYEFLNPRISINELLARIKCPVLDIYGSRDFEEVITHAQARRAASRQDGRQEYTQVMIEDADHYYTGLEAVLVSRLQVWLEVVAPAAQVITEPE